MNVSEPFIRRPIATSLLMVGVILMGWLGYALLPISALPPVDFPTIQVTAQYPGASPDVMASSVTTPLERQFGQISGLAMMSSVSSFGNTAITLQFVLDRDIDAAGQDVQAAINAAGGVLPKMPNPPIYNKVNPADSPILKEIVQKKKCDIRKLVEFASRFPNVTTRKRIGLALDELGIKGAILKPLIESVDKTAISSLTDSRKGSLNTTWRILSGDPRKQG